MFAIERTQLNELPYPVGDARYQAGRYADAAKLMKALIEAPHFVEFLRAWEALANDSGTASAP